MANKTETVVVRLEKSLARDLKRIAREGGSNKSAEIRKAVEAHVHPSPNRDWYVAELMKDACAYVSEELRKQIDELKSGDRVEKAVAAVLAAIPGDVLRKAIDPNNAMQYYNPNSYPNGFQEHGGYSTPELAALARKVALAQMGITTEDSTDNTERAWNPEDDSSDGPASTGPKLMTTDTMAKALFQMGVRSDRTRLAKNDDGPKDPNHRGFTLAGNDEFQKRELRTAAARERQEKFLNRQAGDSFVKSAIDRSGARRDPKELDGLAKSIARGDTGTANSASDAIAEMFSSSKLRKA